MPRRRVRVDSSLAVASLVDISFVLLLSAVEKNGDVEIIKKAPGPLEACDSLTVDPLPVRNDAARGAALSLRSSPHFARLRC